MDDSKGMFIVFEGIGASGKSTQVKRLAEHLTSLGLDVVVTREPGGTPFGEDLRAAFLKHDDTTPTAQLLTLMASRFQHLETYIAPMVKSGTIVLCDRWNPSTYANQLTDDDRDLHALFTTLTSRLDHIMRPDAMFVINTNVQTAYKRSLSRGITHRYTEEGIEERQRVAERLMEYVGSRPFAYVINGNAAEDWVAESVRLIADAILAKKEST